MISPHPPMFGGHRHCGSGDLFLVVEEKVSTCSCLNLPLLFISKGHGVKALKSPILVTCASCSNKRKITNNFCQSVQKQC